VRPKKFCPERCLEKASEVFARKGYEGTSFSDLTQALGVNRQSLYDTYGDKKQLYLKAIECAADSFQSKAGLDRPGSSGRQGIEQFFESVLADTARPDHCGCLITNAILEKGSLDEEVADTISRCSAATLSALERCVRRGVEDGSISVRCEPLPTARALFNLLAGLRVSAHTGVTPKELREIVRVTLRMLD
jgi:TetR/AcrR family transcriptional regulator, transcriptional repressor for nem operon